MYLAGLGCTKDYKTAADWLERAAGKQHKYAQYTLAGLYARGQGVEKDLKHAFTLYQAMPNIVKGFTSQLTTHVTNKPLGFFLTFRMLLKSTFSIMG